jgi:hypothetical protein
MAHPLPNFVRASLLGLGVGLMLSAFALVYAAFTNLDVDCEYPETVECTFQETMAADVARLQAYGALGCALLGGGLMLFLRRDK